MQLNALNWQLCTANKRPSDREAAKITKRSWEIGDIVDERGPSEESKCQEDHVLDVTGKERSRA